MSRPGPVPTSIGKDDAPVTDKRRASRIVVNAPALVESIGQPPANLHPNLAAVYERVAAAGAAPGKRFPAVVRDLSTNGAFITADPLPLMARVAAHFHVERVGSIDVVGWVLWRRARECEVPGADGAMVTLPAGFGILFEAIALDVRQAMANLAAH